VARESEGVLEYDKYFTVTKNDTSWLHMTSHTLDFKYCTDIQILAFSFGRQFCMFYNTTLKM
jgi:hypothetical protein